MGTFVSPAYGRRGIHAAAHSRHPCRQRASLPALTAGIPAGHRPPYLPFALKALTGSPPNVQPTFSHIPLDTPKCPCYALVVTYGRHQQWDFLLAY